MGALTPLRSRPFRWLTIGATINELGSSVAPVALAFAVLDLTGSASSLGIVVGARSVANVVFLLLGGVVADRLPRTLVLVWSNVASALTQGAVAAVLLARADSIALLAVLSALNGTVAAFSLPAAAALMPQTVPSAELVPANAVSRLGTNAAMVLGTSIAGVLVVVLGSGWAVAVDAATYLVAGALFSVVRVSPLAARSSRPSVIRELVEGWSGFTSRAWLWVIVAAFSVVNAASVAGIAVLGPLVADETIGRKAWGLVLAAQTVGYVAGGLLAIRLTMRHLLAFGTLCVAGEALPLLALGLHLGLGYLLTASLVAGVSVEQFGVAWQASMQQHVPSDLLARVSSYDMLGSFIAIPVGEVCAGPISEAVGVGATLVGAGVLVLVAVGVCLLSRSVRDLTSVTSQPPATSDNPRPGSRAEPGNT